jgi:uncharacterized protein YxjI
VCNCHGTELIRTPKKELTLRDGTEGSQKVGSLTVLAICILQHSKQETKLTAETVFFWTIHGNVRYSNFSQRQGEMKHLEHRVTIRIGDMCLQSTILCVIIESIHNEK